jgi:dolichol kinase
MKHMKEYTRKALHIIFGVFFLGLIHTLGTKTSFWILLLAMILGITVSILITRKIKFPILGEIVQKVERENEKKIPGKAAIMFFASALILLFLFQNEKTIILASISVQVFADAFAAIIGINFGKHKLIAKKTIEGSTACFVTALICIAYFYPIPTALIGALIATIIEVLPLDDNLCVPLGTALTLKLL